jgi:hypothetical protein
MTDADPALDCDAELTSAIAGIENAIDKATIEIKVMNFFIVFLLNILSFD